MPVHASSVISTQIQAFDSALYTNLTDKENYCYTTANANISIGSEITTYQPKFLELNNAIIAYLSINRNGIISDVITNYVGYTMMHSLYGTDFSQAPNIVADALFTINGFPTAINIAPVSHYADYNGTTFANLDASITDVGAAHAAEVLLIENIQASMVAVVKAQSMKLMLDDIATVGAAPSKQDIGWEIFGSAPGQLKYKQYNGILNLGLTPPAYIV